MATTTINIADSRFGKLRSLALKTGKSEDQIVTEAVNRFIDEIENPEMSDTERREAILAAAGIWKDRDDLSDEFFERLRKESNRYTGWNENSNGK